MDTTMTANVQVQIDTLEGEMDRAEVEGDHHKRQELYEKQSALYKLLPGSSDPIVGGSGRVL